MFRFKEWVKPRSWGVLALVLGLAGLPAAASRDDERRDPPGNYNPCVRTAHRMLQACWTDSQEEFIVAGANCLNISSNSARRDCEQAASRDRREARDLCEEQFDARRDACVILEEYRYDPDPLLDRANEFVNPDDIPDRVPANPYNSLEAGLVRVLRGGVDQQEVVVIFNTDETREINGVDCRIVAEVAMEVEESLDEGSTEYEYIPTEITFDYFAQTAAGDVIYCGESTAEYEDGFVASTDGTFIAGQDQAKSGYLVLAAPRVGAAHRQEFALGEAEDYIVYESLAATPPEKFGGENEAFPCDGGCLQTRDLTPISPFAVELKYYLPGVGFVLALPFEIDDDGDAVWTGEREALACAGDDLGILEDRCGIEDPAALLETLCAFAGESFCGE